jgi:hypothetical protein
MAWRIKATYYDACNCELGCSCNMSGFPTYGKCEGVVAFSVTVFLAEKNWRHGAALTKVVGTLVITLGLGVLVQPTLLASISV